MPPMDGTPNFNEIARVAVMTFYDTTPRNVTAEREAVANITAKLRQAWNARGAADAQLFAGDLDERDVRERIATLDR